MEALNYAQYAIIGAVINIATYYIKKHYNVHGYLTVLYVIIASIVLGAIYAFLQDTWVLGEFVKILSGSSTIYSLLTQHLQDDINKRRLDIL